MQNLTNIAVIKSLLVKYNFKFSKALGQNFLINPSVCPKMSELGGAQKGKGIIEIGPGIGVLTRELAIRADKVVCIEIDDRLIPILSETLSEYSNVKVINEDVLKMDLHKLIKDEFPDMEVSICANLPYYITSPIIMALLEEKLPITSVTVMVQREAAQRLCSELGQRECGAISGAVWYHSVPSQLFDVSRGSFMPAPEVDSTVIRFDVRKSPPVDIQSETFFFNVIKGAFSQRRKTAVNAISSHIGVAKGDVTIAFEKIGLATSIRAEKMLLEDFARLSNELLPLLRTNLVTKGH